MSIVKGPLTRLILTVAHVIVTHLFLDIEHSPARNAPECMVASQNEGGPNIDP